MGKYNYCGLTGDIVTKDDINYVEDRQEWNRDIQKYPLVIVYCYTKKDITNALCWAKNNSVCIRIRTGGHSYEGYSIENNRLIIDISKMNNICIDEEENIVKIQGGTKNFELYEFLGTKGYSFPGGSCPTVGVAGYAQGGGWGFSSRIFGLGCDNLLEIEIIDYKGEIIIANSTSNSDLYWALKGGGGGNFGIVLAMTFKLPPKINKVTLISINYSKPTLDEEIEIFDTLQNMFPLLDRRMNFRASFYNSLKEKKGVYIIGLFYGSQKEAFKIIKPFEDISDDIEINSEYITFLEATKEIGENYPPYEKFKSTGGFVYSKYSEKEIRDILDFINERPKGSIFTAVSIYGLGGAVNDVNKSSTAFYYRGCQYILGIQTVWENDKDKEINKCWFNEKYDMMKNFFVGAYVNFPYCGILDYENKYYGSNLKRLKSIKSKYDPFNVFRFQQSIEP